MSTLESSITAGSLLAIFIGGFRMLWSKLNNLEKTKVDKEESEKFDERFLRIEQKLDEHGTTLARIDERLILLMRRNGIHGD